MDFLPFLTFLIEVLAISVLLSIIIFLAYLSMNSFLKKKDKTKKDEQISNFLIALGLTLILLLICPSIVNWFMESNNRLLNTAVGLEKSDWLSFWGSYLGSSLGIICTICIFFFTFFENKEQIKEQNRLQMLPAFELTKEHTGGGEDYRFEVYDKDLIGVESAPIHWGLLLTNIGQAAATQVTFCGKRLSSVASQKNLALLLAANPKGYSTEIRIEYIDLLNNRYYQKTTLDFENGVMVVHPLTSPELIK